MESFAELIKKRRSIRKFTNQLLSPEQVESLLKAALMAPSSKRSNAWQFVLVENKEMLQKLASCKKNGSSFLETAALAIVVLANPMESDVWVEDASVASIYIQLQAEDLGLGSCWCQIRNRETAGETDSAQYVRDLLDIPCQMEVLSIIGVGYKDQDRKPFDETHLQWEKIHIDKFVFPSESESSES